MRHRPTLRLLTMVTAAACSAALSIGVVSRADAAPVCPGAGAPARLVGVVPGAALEASRSTPTAGCTRQICCRAVFFD